MNLIPLIGIKRRGFLVCVCVCDCGRVYIYFLGFGYLLHFFFFFAWFGTVLVPGAKRCTRAQGPMTEWDM